MTITQTVEIPADYRILLELPRSIPSGVMAQVKIDIPAFSTEEISSPILQSQSVNRIEDIRQLLKKEMTINGTATVTTASGDGWEAYVRERYAKS